MGTPCLTIFQDEEGQDVAVMYRQRDGYPARHGLELARCLNQVMMVMGLGSADGPNVANGMPCLAARVVAEFKIEPGYIYLHPAGSRDYGEFFRYYVTGRHGQEPHIRMTRVGTFAPEQFLFEGPASEIKRLIEAGEV